MSDKRCICKITPDLGNIQFLLPQYLKQPQDSYDNREREKEEVEDKGRKEENK